MSVYNSTVSLHSFISKSGKVDIEHKDETAEEPKVPRYRNYLTICLFLSFMALGMAASVVGPAFLHLTYIFDTDIKTLAISFTFGSIGYLSGSFACGIIFDRFNAELQITVATSMIGAAVIIAPWAPSIYLYYVIDCLKAFSMGFLDACGQTYVISLWNEHRLKEPMMHAMHGIWSVGATLCPFIVVPFLSDLPEQNDMNEANVTSTLNETGVLYETESEIEGLETVKYCFAIVGCLVILMSSCFLIGFCALGPSCRRDVKRKTNQVKDTKNINNSNLSKLFIGTVLSLQFLFYGAYAWCELIPGGYAATFVIKGLNWDVKKGPLITSVFWGFLGLGRITAIPVSYFVTPGKMVANNLTFTTIAFVMMLFVPLTGEALMWCSTALAGFAMSSTFASMILWTSSYISITGTVGAVFLTGSSFGGMFGGTMAGYLFQTYSHMWVVYLSLIACTADVVLFIVLILVVKCFKVEKKHNTDNKQNVEQSESHPMNAVS